MTDYLARTRSVSAPVDVSGVYLGTVTRVDEALQQVWVEVARLTPGFQYGPLTVTGVALPAVGERVAVEFLENRTNDIVVLGVVRTPMSPDYVPPVACTSTTRPPTPRVGTLIFESDTAATYVWTGTVWQSLVQTETVYDAGEVDGVYDIDLGLGAFHVLTVVGAVTVTVSGAPPAGQVGRFTAQITMGPTLSAVTWPESFQWGFGLGPLAPTEGEGLTISAYTLTAGDVWYVGVPDYAS